MGDGVSFDLGPEVAKLSLALHHSLGPRGSAASDSQGKGTPDMRVMATHYTELNHKKGEAFS